jgi:hypothetical protein
LNLLPRRVAWQQGTLQLKIEMPGHQCSGNCIATRSGSNQDFFGFQNKGEVR